MKSLFNHLNEYYWNSIQDRQGLSGLTSKDSWVEPLIHFCNYAFERAGSPEIYRESAKDALRNNRNWLQNRERWSDEIEVKIFETFSQICNEGYLENLNLKNNPMSPSNNNQISMVRFAWNETEGETIAYWAVNCINKNQLSEAHTKLKNIRGVGDKIASFYLRDIFILSENKSRDLDNKYLLQPIDVWTRRAARCLMNDQNASDQKCAEFLIDYEDKVGLQNGSLNIALWVLGSQIVEDGKIFVEYIESIKQENKDALRRKLAKIISSEKEWIGFLETIYNGL